jgi:hypothetical protein
MMSMQKLFKTESGLKDSVEDYNNKGLSGVKWAIETMLGNGGILPRSTLEKNIEQSDCLSQLRLVVDLDC